MRNVKLARGPLAPVTDSHAVRDFTISNTDPRGGSIRLLETPALGFSPTFHFQLVHGKLVS
jgi:hypothetical protein